jgi:hypothetical protein
MKRIILFLLLALLTVSSAVFSQMLERIPRRVVFIQEGDYDFQDPDRKALGEGFVDYLYTSISKLQPIVRVDDPDIAHSRVIVIFRSEAESVRIEVVLEEEGRSPMSQDYLWGPDDETMEGYTAFIEETAVAFAPHLDLVIPEVEAVDFSEVKKLVEVKEQMDYADLLNKRWELTLWFSGVNRVFHDPVRDDPETLDTRFSLFPISFDVAYYFNRNLGIYASLFFDYSDFFAFGTIDEDPDGPVDKARSENLFLLPGVGFSYRTLGLFSAQFNVGFYYGFVSVVPIDSSDIGDSGEQLWFGYSSLAISSILAWNFTPTFALKTKIGINLDLVNMFKGEGAPYSMDYNGFFLTFFSIGTSARL